MGLIYSTCRGSKEESYTDEDQKCKDSPSQSDQLNPDQTKSTGLQNSDGKVEKAPEKADNTVFDDIMTTGSNKSDDELTHVKSRNSKYPGSDIDRFPVTDDHVSWRVEYPDYKPVEYTTTIITEDKPVWADVDDSDSEYVKIKFNALDGKNDRQSFTGHYAMIRYENGVLRPRNPIGRTGISGRGLLGKWGPNHAADPIVTRWKRDENGKTVVAEGDNKPILEFVAIQRHDNREWAIPGGMVDKGETVSVTLKREFGEEAMNSLVETEREGVRNEIDKLFQHGEEIYKGYVDDPRNTDNSWMETVAVNFHDGDGTTVGKIPLKAGDDARNVMWLAIDRELKLYASHYDFIKKTCARRGAFFPHSK